MYSLVTLSTLGFITLLLGVFKKNSILLPVTILGLATAFVFNCMRIRIDAAYYTSMMQDDRFAIAFTNVMICVTALVCILAHYQFKKDMHNAGEFYTLLIFVLVGAQVMVSYTNITMLFIGIEILSISLYVLAGWNKKDPASNEAALKYFLIGSFASGFLLMGIALVYGATNSLNVGEIAKVQVIGATSSPMLMIGILMILAGLAFKISAAPFHFWAPDVYEGSPTLVTSFMSTVVKIAGIAAFFKLFFVSFGGVGSSWVNILTVIAVLSMTIGNITALYQKNFQRLLAYSSISHAGYLLIGIIVLNLEAAGAVLYYSIAYALASLTAFTVLLYLSSKTGTKSIESFNGLAKRNPWMALAMTIAMLSLTGIPPLAGFFGKYYLFSLAIRGGHWWLAGFGILNSLISVYYYFYIIISMYVKEPAEDGKLANEWSSSFVVGLCAIGSIVVGFIPEVILRLVN